MMVDHRKKKAAEKVLDLIVRKFEIAELNLHAVAVEVRQLHGKVDDLNRTMIETMSITSAESAFSSLPNWRARISTQKTDYEREIDKLKPQIENCKDAVETALREKQALTAYIRRQKKAVE